MCKSLITLLSTLNTVTVLVLYKSGTSTSPLKQANLFDSLSEKYIQVGEKALDGYSK